MKVPPLLWGVMALGTVSTSCSTGPAPGTPAFLWNAAKQTYESGDFIKAHDNLQDIVQSENEYTSRARAWLMVLAAGLTQGHAELADAYEAGAGKNRTNPLAFRKEVSAQRHLAATSALELAQAARSFREKDQAPEVMLAFAYPTGSVNQPPGLKKVSDGTIIPDSEKAQLETTMVRRGVVLAASAAVGSPEDPAKALENFKAGEAHVPRGTFLYATAKALADNADLFSSKKLDQVDRFKVMYEEASQALRLIPETKETKQLDYTIKSKLKKGKPS